MIELKCDICSEKFDMQGRKKENEKEWLRTFYLFGLETGMTVRSFINYPDFYNLIQNDNVKLNKRKDICNKCWNEIVINVNKTIERLQDLSQRSDES